MDLKNSSGANNGEKGKEEVKWGNRLKEVRKKRQQCTNKRMKTLKKLLNLTWFSTFNKETKTLSNCGNFDFCPIGEQVEVAEEE